MTCTPPLDTPEIFSLNSPFPRGTHPQWLWIEYGPEGMLKFMAKRVGLIGLEMMGNAEMILLEGCSEESCRWSEERILGGNEQTRRRIR
jgi:hypothetical protein